MCLLGSLSQYSTVSEYSCVKVDDDIPLEKAALVGCGVPTGWCSAVYAADVEPGETVMIYGIGGVGANAVQGAAHAGAANVIAVDPLANKRETAEDLGATHSAENVGQAHEIAQELTRGVGADKAIITVDIVNEQVVAEAFEAVRKGGTVVITGLADPNKLTVQLSSGVMTLYQKQLKGTLFGSGNPMADIPKLIGLYQAGKLKLDELITKTYTLDEVNQGFAGHARRQEHPGRGDPRALTRHRCWRGSTSGSSACAARRRCSPPASRRASTSCSRARPGRASRRCCAPSPTARTSAWSSSRATPS